jgi:hypothetical protein
MVMRYYGVVNNSGAVTVLPKHAYNPTTALNRAANKCGPDDAYAVVAATDYNRAVTQAALIEWGMVQRALVVKPVEKTPDLGYSLLPPPQSLEGEIR